MEGDKIFMSQRQLQRYHALKLVEAGKLTLREAAEMIGVSYRHAKQINKKVQKKGAKGLFHGNTGRSPGNRIPPEVKERVLELSRESYPGFNDRHFGEKRHDIGGNAGKSDSGDYEDEAIHVKPGHSCGRAREIGGKRLGSYQSHGSVWRRFGLKRRSLRC